MKQNQPPLSLHPLKFREAVRDLLQVKPEPKRPSKTKRAKASKPRARRSAQKK